MKREAAPFEGATHDRVAAAAGLAVGRAGGREPTFPVAPGEAFCERAEVWAGAARARAILELHARGGAGAPAGRSATIEPRLPSAPWHHGIAPPPAMAREDHLFVLTWRGVATVEGSHGDLGLLDPASVMASNEGAPLPGAAALRAEAPALLERLADLPAGMPVERRLRARIAQLMSRAGVGTAAGMRLRLGLTHVQWPVLVGAPEHDLHEAFEHLIRSGVLVVEERSLIVPWEAWAALALDA
jgi:hypothetical protein